MGIIFGDLVPQGGTRFFISTPLQCLEGILIS